MKWCIILVVLVLGTACQSGRIACPKFKAPKLARSTPQGYTSYAVFRESEEEEPKPLARSTRPQEKFVGNVSIEEWDCPQPGSKKYLPKQVRQNIRSNFRKFNEDQSRPGADTVVVR